MRDMFQNINHWEISVPCNWGSTILVLLMHFHFFATETLFMVFLCRYLDAGRDMVVSLQYGARCPCGYCHISDVELHTQEDHMESFFLAETVRINFT